jgi:hypothetical protein
MANEEKLYIECDACGGDGIIQRLVVDPEPPNTEVWVDVPCTKCLGSGVRRSGNLAPELIIFLQDLSDRVDDVMDKCNDIFEKVSE